MVDVEDIKADLAEKGFDVLKIDGLSRKGGKGIRSTLLSYLSSINEMKSVRLFTILLRSH